MPLLFAPGPRSCTLDRSPHELTSLTADRSVTQITLVHHSDLSRADNLGRSTPEWSKKGAVMDEQALIPANLPPRDSTPAWLHGAPEDFPLELGSSVLVARHLAAVEIGSMW